MLILKVSELAAKALQLCSSIDITFPALSFPKTEAVREKLKCYILYFELIQQNTILVFVYVHEDPL